MKSIFKNKMPLLISLILVVVMVFGSVCYASSDDNFSDDDFKDTGYSDGSLKSVDDVLEFAGAIDVNNSKIYQSAVQRWGAGNVDCYYVICTSPCGTQVKYSIYSRHYSLINWIDPTTKAANIKKPHILFTFFFLIKIFQLLTFTLLNFSD